MVKILFIAILFCNRVLTEEALLQTQSSNCKYWSHYNPETNTCDCGSGIFGVVSCETAEGANTDVNVSVFYGYCMTLSTGKNEAIVGACPYHYLNCLSHCDYVAVLKNLSTDFCGVLKRTGQLCGQCLDGYSPPVYSYYPQCVRCTNGTNNWPRYLTISLLPPTILFLATITFRFRATAPSLNGYILFSQVFSASPTTRYLGESILKNHYEKMPTGYVLDALIALHGIWNLDFFRLFYTPFCLQPNANTLQVLSLDYVIAVYPLLLIILTYTLVRLHYNNYRLVVWLWRPFIGCFARCRRQWDIQNSLIDAFATFFLLSYVKFFSVSFDLLTPTILWDSKAGVAGAALYYDGSKEYFGMHHLPYALLAISVLMIFTFFPILLLCLYPCRCFQRLLNKGHCNTQALHHFMDSFQGCFKDGTNGTKDCRYFTAMYLITRTAIHLAFIVTNNTFSTFFQTVLLLAMILLLICFQPYKKQLHTNTDAVFLVLLCIIVNSAWEVHGKTYRDFSSKVDRLYVILLPLPVMYLLYLILNYLLRRSANLRAMWMDRLRKCCSKKNTASDPDVTSPLLKVC